MENRACAALSLGAADCRSNEVISSTQSVAGPLDGIVALVEVRGNCENRFRGVAREVEKLGGKAVNKFRSGVTHLIFQNGKPHIREKAVKKGIPVVSVLWLESCRQTGELASEAKYPVLDNESTPVILGKLKRVKSMQPKSFDEELSKSLERARRKRDKELQRAACQSPSEPGPRILCEDTQPQSWPSVTPDIVRGQHQFIPDTEPLESGCEETESLEVQSNFYGFKYRDIEKDQDMLKTRETGSQSAMNPSEKLNFCGVSGSGVVCTVGESPTTVSYPSKKTGISQTPTSSDVPGPSTKCKQKRKLLTRDMLPPFDAEQGAETATTDTQKSSKSKRKRYSKDEEVKPSDKESTSKVIKQPCTEHGGKQSCNDSTETDKDLSSGKSSVRDRTSLAPFDTPKKWRRPQSSGANGVTKSRVRKEKRKRVSDGDGSMESRDKQEKRQKTQHPTKGKKKAVKEQKTLVMTSVPNKDRELVVSVIRKLGGFSLESSVTESTTHVVFSQPRRTLTVLTAIARGCWLLSIDWVYKSVESGHWVDEKPFEVDDLFPAAKVCREERMTCEGQYNSQLFSSCPPIFIGHDANPPSEHLCQLVMLCGGKLTMSRRRDNALCVGQKASSGGAWVSEQWIMDCVTQNRLVSTGAYTIE